MAFGNPYGEAYNVDMVFERLYRSGMWRRYRVLERYFRTRDH